MPLFSERLQHRAAHERLQFVLALPSDRFPLARNHGAGFRCLRAQANSSKVFFVLSWRGALDRPLPVVRCQSFWDRFGVELRERLAHLFGVQAAVAK